MSCKCYDRMGNDFFFLPADKCLYGKCTLTPRKEPCVEMLIDWATTPGLGLTRADIDPIRGGVIQ